MDLAYQVQWEFERACVHLATRLQQATGSKNLALNGGCALNSVANQKLLGEAGFDQIFVLPAASDDGNAIGAAYYGYLHARPELERKPPAPIPHAYLGRTYSEDEIKETLERFEVSYEEEASREAAAVRAGNLLAEGKIVGWFQGGSEFGPRALGNRSILANPYIPGIKETLNARVKYREAFPPQLASKEGAWTFIAQRSARRDADVRATLR